MPKGRTAQHQVNVLVNKVLAMRIGTSFFVDGVTAQDMVFLRRPVVRAGAGIRIVQVEVDEIYQCHGVRVWREEGVYDEL